MSALVSMIIPVYNSATFLETCVRSVMGQTYPNIELILMDDGSTDNSSIILDRLLEKDYTPKRIRVYHHENCGPGMTRNAGIEKATGEYLMFADNDDDMSPDYVETMVHLIEEKQADMIVSGFRRVDSSGNVLYEHRLMEKSPWSCFRMLAPWGKIMRRSFVSQNHLQFGGFLMGEDSFFSITAYNSSEKIYASDYIGYNWVYRATSVSNTLQKSAKVDIFPSLEAILKRNSDCRHIRPDLFEYFFVKYIVGSLTFIAEMSDATVMDEYCVSYFSWLQKNFPNYRKNLFISPFRPMGELVGIRITVWLLAKLPMGLKKLILRGYKTIKKIFL